MGRGEGGEGGVAAAVPCILYNGPPGDTYCLVHCWKTTYSLSVPFPEFLWRKRNLLTRILPLPPISAFLHHPRWRIDWSFDCWLIGGRLLVSTNAVQFISLRNYRYITCNHWAKCRTVSRECMVTVWLQFTHMWMSKLSELKFVQPHW